MATASDEERLQISLLTLPSLWIMAYATNPSHRPPKGGNGRESQPTGMMRSMPIEPVNCCDSVCTCGMQDMAPVPASKLVESQKPFLAESRDLIPSLDDEL